MGSTSIYRKAHLYLGDKIITKKINVISDDRREKKSIHYAWLNVENNEYLDLEDCYADLDVARVKFGGTWQPMNSLNPNHAKLTWPNFKREENVIVRRGNKERINIAKTNGGKLYFIFKNGDKEATNAGSEFYIEVSINGEIGGKSIKGLVFKGILKYETILIELEGMKNAVDEYGNEIDIKPSLENYQRLWIEEGELPND